VDQHTINRVTRIVYGVLNASFDRDSVVMDILFESWRNQVDEPSRAFITHRCRDAVRFRTRETRKLKASMFELTDEKNHTDVAQVEQRIDKLMKILSNFEKKVVWYRFYAELSIADTAQQVNSSVSHVRETLSGALFKMRSAEDE
jgi:DNA-directed RNA polymerase specialized sigma24 family protein